MIDAEHHSPFGDSSEDSPAERVEAEAFLSALVRGAPWAAEEAWDRYSPMVHKLMRRGLGPGADVDDAVQEVFLRLFQRLRTIRDATALRSYVFSIGVRVMRWQLRRRSIRRLVHLSDTGELPEISTPPLDPEAREAVRRIYAVLEKLGATERTIFVLRQTEELSLPQIARVVELSLSTVKRRMEKVTARVRRLVAADPMLAGYLSQRGLDVLESVAGDD